MKTVPDWMERRGDYYATKESIVYIVGFLLNE